MKENRFSCPKCNFWLNSAQMRRRGNPYFQCPSCGEKLCISPTYMRFLRYAGLVLALAVPAVLQIWDPLRFIGVALLAWFPVQVLLTTLAPVRSSSTYYSLCLRFYRSTADVIRSLLSPMSTTLPSTPGGLVGAGARAVYEIIRWDEKAGLRGMRYAPNVRRA